MNLKIILKLIKTDFSIYVYAMPFKLQFFSIFIIRIFCKVKQIQNITIFKAFPTLLFSLASLTYKQEYLETWLLFYF